MSGETPDTGKAEAPAPEEKPAADSAASAAEAGSGDKAEATKPAAEAPSPAAEGAPPEAQAAAPAAEAPAADGATGGDADEDEAAAKAKAAAAAKAKAAAAAKAKAAATPPRPLPSPEDIAAWAGGADANVGILFEDLKLARYDAFNMQIRNKEIIGQHWQVISSTETPDEAEFDGLPEVGRLRVLYKDQELSRQRLGALKVAWIELRGLRPSHWALPDLMAALRRIIQKGLDVDFNHLLAATRDLWRSSKLPASQDQVDLLWASLALIRKGTKK
jgi:hypothetical protein